MKKLLIILTFLPLFGYAQHPCATFDGSNNYISIANDTNLSFGNSTTDEAFFISADLYMEDATEFRYIAKTSDNDPFAFEYILFFNSSDRLVALLYSQGSTSVYIGQLSASSYTSLENQWINVIVAYDGSSTAAGIDLYIDGSPVSSSPISSGSYVAMNNEDIPFTIGSDRTILSDGRISNVRVCEGSITASDITTLQSPLQKTGKEVAWWPLSEGYSDVVHNTIDRTMLGFSTNDISSVLWDNTQSNFDYDSTYGFTRFAFATDTVLVPYLSDSSRYVQDVSTAILNGQSNAMGRAELDSLSGADSIKYWKEFSQVYICDTVNVEWELLDAGVNNYYDATAVVDGFGPELSLAYEWEDNNSTPFYLYKYGKKETTLDTNTITDDWYPTSGELFSQNLENLRECIEVAPDYGVNPMLKSYVWMQGESDGSDSGRAAHYYTNLNYYFDSLTTNFNTPFNKTICRISNSTVYPYGSVVIMAQSDYVIAKPDETLISTTYYERKTDNVHYNHTGQIEFGGDIYLDLINKSPVSLLNILDINFDIHDYPDIPTPIQSSSILKNNSEILKLGKSILIFNQ